MGLMSFFAPRVTKGVYGLMAEYDSPDTLLEACKAVRDAGYKKTDSFSPFPIHGMEEALGLPESNVGKIAILFSFAGAGIALLLQWWTAVKSYPLIVGGKPLFAFEPSIPITFELTVLLSCFSSVFIMLALNGLPRFNHPVFGAKGFERVGDDRFMLPIEKSDPKFDETATRQLLEGTHPKSTQLVESN